MNHFYGLEYYQFEGSSDVNVDTRLQSHSLAFFNFDQFRAKECRKTWVMRQELRLFKLLETVPKVMYSKDLDIGTYKEPAKNAYRAEFNAFCWPDSYILNFTQS